MLRKIVLFVATFALICIAFAIYQWREDERFPVNRSIPPGATPRLAGTRPVGTTQTTPADHKSVAIGGWASLLPGGGSKITVYDRNGEAKIILQANQWEPVTETEFHLVVPSARVLLPGGQLTYVQADEGQVKVRGTDKQNLTPKSGWFKGNVRITIDLTKPDWRRENPDQAEPEKHPHGIVKILLADARFDLDLARLECDGPVTVESERGTLEGRGLELIWNESTRRVKFLRIKEGKQATLKGQAFNELTGMPGGSDLLITPPLAEPPPTSAPAETTVVAETPIQQPPKPKPEESSPREITFLNPEREAATLKKDRIDTYHIKFKGNITATQRENGKLTGQLKGAETVSVLTDIGREERTSLEYAPGSPSMTGARKPAKSRPAGASTAPESPAKLPVESTLALTWTGEVSIVAEEPAETQPVTSAPAPTPEKRLHLVAEGSNVELQDAKNGHISCKRLEYHNENKQVWLTGSPGDPVVMSAASDSKLIVDKTLFFDRQTGIARIEGAGRMIRQEVRSNPADGRSLPEMPDMLTKLGEPATDFELAWQGSGEIIFGRAEVPATKPATTTRPAAKESFYVKHATFKQGVKAVMSNQSIAADLMDISFLPPRPKSERENKGTGDNLMAGTTVDRVVATGNVLLNQKKQQAKGLQSLHQVIDTVACRHLEIQMGIDDNGRNVPRLGQATGHVLARQWTQPMMGPIAVGMPQIRDIRADDEMTIEMASIPKPITDEQRQRFETYARSRGLTPESPEWKKVEEKLRNRRDIVLKKLIAHGNVGARDEKQELHDLSATALDCTFDENGRIHRVLVSGPPDKPASVDHGTFYISGQQLSLDLSTQAVRVPGKGLLKFANSQDIDGRPLAKPAPVTITWDREMWLRGNENIGAFEGRVRLESQNNLLTTETLNLRFADEPASGGKTADTAIAAEQEAQMDNSRNIGAYGKRMRKRLVRADAASDTVVVSSTYEDGPGSQSNPFADLVGRLIPASLKVPASQQSASPTSDKRRLLSRIRIAGPLMRIDLNEEQFLVDGAGNLLIEDYHIPKDQPKTGSQSEMVSLVGPSGIPSMSSTGPSQTLFTWAKNMSFLNRKNVAVMEEQVTMRHRAGAEMALASQLESALRLDEATRRKITSRAATLTCNSLIVEFDRSRDQARKISSSLSTATALKGFQAQGNVLLMNRESDTQREASGMSIVYDSASTLARIEGSTRQPAVIQEVDTRSGRLNGQWRGYQVKWNMKTREIVAEGSIVNAPR